MRLRAFAAAAALLLALPDAARAQPHPAHNGEAQADDPAASGQAAFAALANAVARLEGDPATDWSRANLGALREHLVDMDGVFLRARVSATPVAGGARFDVTGDGQVAGAIRRMTTSHAAMADGDAGRHIVVTPLAQGAAMTVTAQDAAGAARIRALGFFGLLASGSHHQRHHLMLARGEAMAP